MISFQFNKINVLNEYLLVNKIENLTEKDAYKVFIETITTQKEKLIAELSDSAVHRKIWRSLKVSLEKSIPESFQEKQTILGDRSIEEVMNEIQEASSLKCRDGLREELELKHRYLSEYVEKVGDVYQVKENLSKKQIHDLMQKAISWDLPHLTFYTFKQQWKPLGGPIVISPELLVKLLEIYGNNRHIKDWIATQISLGLHPIIPFCQRHGYDKEDELLFQKLIDLGYPIDNEVLKMCLLHQHEPFITLILNSVNDHWLKKNAGDILRVLMLTEHPTSMELLNQRFPRLASHCSEELFIEAVKNGKEVFISWLLANGIHLKSNKTKEKRIFKLIQQTYNLRLIRKFYDYARENQMNLIPDSTLMDPIPWYVKVRIGRAETYLTRTLFKYAMCSPLKDVYEFVHAHPEFYRVLPSVLRKVSLCVRFPSLDLASKISSNRDAYLSSSFAYAEENEQFIRITQTKLKDFSREELIDAIAKNRYERLPISNESRQDYIKNQIREATTDLYAGEYHRLEGYKQVTGINRYHWSLRHLNRFKKKSNPFFKNDVFSFFYTLPLTGEKIEVTNFRGGWWIHPANWSIRQLKEHLRELQEEIFAYQLDRDDAENQRLFFEKVARSYWLTATICEKLRGTPHNAMMWLNLVYEHHGLMFPIPKQKHFFLDNTMLMKDVEDVIPKWSSFFEPTLDESLTFRSEKEKRKYFKQLLKDYPELARLCSKKVL